MPSGGLTVGDVAFFGLLTTMLIGVKLIEQWLRVNALEKRIVKLEKEKSDAVRKQ